MSVKRELVLTGDFYGVTVNKGEIIVNNGIKNSNLPTSTDGYILSLDSTQTLGLQWIPPPTGGTTSIMNNQIILTALPWATNSTSPVAIAQFSNAPPNGNILILCSIIFILNKSNHFLTAGFYKNGILISASQRTISAAPSTETELVLQFISNFSGTDVLEVKVNIDNNTNTNAIITSGILQTFAFASVYQVNIVGVLYQTNALIPVPVPDMTFTFPASGTFAVLFNMEFLINRFNQYFTVYYYNNGTLISSTTRQSSAVTSTIECFQHQFISAFTTSDVFKIYVSVTGNNTTLSINERNLIFIPL